MKLQWIVSVVCLVCLVLASNLSAQDDPKTDGPEKVVRLCSKSLPEGVDVQAYLSTGEITLVNGDQIAANKVLVGPAPAPYPQPVFWEKGIEQLGPTSITCDGMWFINGNLWQPNKIALALWKIRIPASSQRLASEFNRDLTMSLWVDTNEDKAWGKNELVFRESFNIQNWFPNNWSCLEIWYLTWFSIPSTTALGQNCGGGATKYETKLWTRCAISYDDADVSPAGQFLFGEVEDYRFNYFEIKYPQKHQG
jgi:hypothetical protein